MSADVQSVQHLQELLQMSDRRVLDLEETVNAAKSELLHMQEKIEAQDHELKIERRARKKLEQSAAEWGQLEKQYADKITELRERGNIDSRLALTDEESKRIDLMKKSQDENMSFRRKLEDLKNKNEAAEKQLETMRRRLQEKDQAAELTYQKSLQFQDLQSKQFTRQINKMIKEQERERADYENQLAVKDNELQGAEAQHQLRTDITRHGETSTLVPPSDHSNKLRAECERLSTEVERIKSEKDSKVRELQHLVNKRDAEAVALQEKCERLARTAHARHVKVGQLQTRITASAHEMKDVEMERDATISRLTADVQRAAHEGKRAEDTIRHELNTTRETIEQLRLQLEQQDRSARDAHRNTEERNKTAVQRMEDDALLKARDHEETLREAASLRERLQEVTTALQRTKEERTVYGDDLHRAIAKAHDLERELRATTDLSTKLAERDAKLLSERDALKVYVGQCKLELEKGARERHKIAQRLQDAERKLVVLTQGTSSGDMLAICGRQERRGGGGGRGGDAASALSLRRGIVSGGAASAVYEPPTAEDALLRYPSSRTRASLVLGDE